MDERVDARGDTQAVTRLNRWRSLRITLGQLQIIGSTAAFILLLSQGITAIVLWIFSATMAVTLVSIFLFKVLKVQEREQRTVE